MGLYKNITSAGIITLITKESKNTNRIGSSTGYTSDIEKITISNNSTSNPATVSLQLWDGTSVGYNFIGNMVIPSGVTLVLEDNLSFDKSQYNLRMEVSGTSPILDVIIK
tara:strand:+ start:5206 stop:5535 length:330 start_codon:yes stop_codon:yes gene_type:complete